MVVDCFHKQQADEEYYTVGYCTGNLIIELCSYLVFAQCVCIFVWHLKKKGITSKETYYSSATYLLTGMIIFEFIVLCRYTFNMYAWYSFYMGLMVFQTFLSSLILFLVLYYFAKKAGLLLTNDERIWLTRFLNILGSICVFLFVGTAILQGVEYSDQVFNRLNFE